MSDAPAVPRGTWILLAGMGVLLVLQVRTQVDLHASRESVAEAVRAAGEARSAAQEAAREAGKAAAAAAAGRDDVDMLASGIGAVERKLKELADRIDFGPGGTAGLGAGGNPYGATPGVDPGGTDAPPGQPFLEFTPELRASLARAAAEKGVRLLEDRVEVPARFVLRQGALEYLAVLPGGKSHESVLVLTGEPDADGNAPRGLGATLNSCLMALGLRPGTPVRILPGGRTIPARGTPVHIALEWEEEGKPVRVRAEDLLWDRERGRAMEEGKFIYVGSYFDPEGYVPDLALDAVACYSVATCIVDLDDPRAANDQIFVACGPRIPPEGTKARMVFSPKPLPPTRTWDDAPGAGPGGPGEPPPAAPEKGEGGGK